MSAAPRRILIVRLSAIGDVVRTLPALEALRRADPEAHIAWLVEDRAAAVVQGHPALDAVYVFERRKVSASLRRPWRWPRLLRYLLTFVTELRRRPYDVVFDFQSLLKSGMLAWVSGAPLRIGFAPAYCRERVNARFTNAHVNPGDERLPRVLRNLAFISHFAPPECQQSYAAWPDRADAEAWADDVIASLDGKRPILLHPGTSREEKWWWPSCWGVVGDTLREETGLPVVVTWGPGERAAANAVAESMWGEVSVGPETPTLHHLVALIRRAACFITVDNGPMHLAAMTDTPVTGIFGPVDVLVNQPVGDHVRCVTATGVLRPGDVLPATGGGMHDVRASDVIAAVLELMQHDDAARAA